MTKQKKRRGFTLIEIMVVVVIIGLLSALVGPRLMGQSDEAKRKTTQTQIAQLEQILGLYYLDNGFYPTTSQGLDALITKPHDAARAAQLRRRRLHEENAQRRMGPRLHLRLPRRPRRLRHNLLRSRRTGRGRRRRSRHKQLGITARLKIIKNTRAPRRSPLLVPDHAAGRKRRRITDAAARNAISATARRPPQIRVSPPRGGASKAARNS